MTFAFPLANTPMALGSSPLYELPNLRNGFLGGFFLGFGLFTDILAIGWFGMWLALTVRKPGLAPGLTILLVLILPTLLGPFDLVADMLFISWGTACAQEEFRWVFATQFPSSGME
jgi:hypothetical protein